MAFTDQVGNIRVAYYKDASGNLKIDRTNHYYPFGLEFGGDLNVALSVSPNYRYSSQGQEKQLETGWSSYRWRNYDAAMGRFFNVDPLAEIYNTWSPYTFSGNRVVDARELEGLEPALLPIFAPGAVAAPPGYSIKPGAGSSIYETAKSNAINNYNGLLRVIGTQINVAAAVGSTGLVIANRVLNNDSDKKGNSTAENKGSDTKSEEEGIIYKRKEKTGKEKDYVGQAKDSTRYKKRQREHQRANKDADYEFEEIDRGKPGKDLDRKEQKHIDEGGGPTNKSNPNGGLQNKRNQIKPPKLPKQP